VWTCDSVLLIGRARNGQKDKANIIDLWETTDQ
jgi:hypothetical protein